MNKFVVQFKSDSIFISLAGKAFIFNNQLDAIDYFKKDKSKTCFIKDCKSADASICTSFQLIAVVNFNNNVEYPNCFWAVQPN